LEKSINPWGGAMNNGLNEIISFVSSLWQLKLVTIADIDLSLGNVVVALSLMVFATRLSRLAVRVIDRRLIMRFVSDKGSQTTYQTFAYYGCLAVFIVLALTIAGIPLSVFTVVGGALAIGVGFGSQNIVNNFISGVILLVEKPIRIGDIVEVEGVTGKVVAIGTRSAKIRIADNKVLVVPNSFFLEKVVVNWNLESDILRTTVDFGVAYGSDVNLVEQVCLDIMLNIENIEQSTLPTVYFTDFADSNLNFQLMFFCNVNKVPSLHHVRSEVRFKVDEKFRKHGIQMAFPQRDLNFKVAPPLSVKVLS
jgi:small-conductance mechanosensitive channel